MKIRAIAIDDEVLALQKIARYCSQVDYIDLVERFDDPQRAWYFMKHHKTDLIFLDIQMDELSGIEFLKRLESKPFTILTTAFSHYTLKAFELDVVDYLLKPIRFERFKQATDKVYERFIKEQAFTKTGNRVEESPDDYIFVKSGTRQVKILLHEILFIEGMKDYLSIKTFSQRHMVLQIFDRMIEMLPAERFVRVHRSFIIALDKIETIKSKSVIIRGREIPVSITYRQSFKEAFRKFTDKMDQP